jgi:uncharacterized protein (TIGR02391 family)
MTLHVRQSDARIVAEDLQQQLLKLSYLLSRDIVVDLEEPEVCPARFPSVMTSQSRANAASLWISVMRGEYDSAAIVAFRTVEEAVRAAGGYADTDIGVSLMRRAFHPEDGRLTDKSQPAAERQALSDLFAGALGSYKNPHSHRTVEIKDAVEAQDIVMLASHLLRIVDARRPAVAGSSIRAEPAR